ncbi:MAG TPA: hypothetical protein DFS52_24430, partial [Myxococcales bacterium]|nr:hypothetical protein [Myxococcales bacterium]
MESDEARRRFGFASHRRSRLRVPGQEADPTLPSPPCRRLGAARRPVPARSRRVGRADASASRGVSGRGGGRLSELKTSPRLRLEVRVSGQRVGVLARERHGAIRFTPDAAWLEGGQHPPLGLAFLTDPSPRLAGTGLPPWVHNLLPRGGS